jgi:hypothetical protein
MSIDLKQILVLSDFHAGSMYGLLPPNFVSINGNPIQQNAGQKYLYDCFIKTLNKVMSRPIKYIVINGDLIDGLQKKSNAVPLTLHLLEDQRAAALALLQEVKDRFPNAEWYFIGGTPYHEPEGEVAQIATELLGSPQVVRRTLRLQTGKSVITFHHEVSFSGGFVKSASLEKELLSDLIAHATHGWITSDAQIRSHCHYFRYVGTPSKLAMVTPCWQLQTDFVTKNSPNKTIPDIGAVVLTIDDNLKEQGVCPIGFTEYLYKHPQPEIVISEDVCEEAPNAEVPAGV